MSSDLDALSHRTISRIPVAPDSLAQELAVLGSRWSIDGRDLRLDLRDGKMGRYGTFAAHAAALADELDHHPRIVLEYGRLTLTIHTHDTASITVLDLVYAARLEAWLREQQI